MKYPKFNPVLANKVKKIRELFLFHSNKLDLVSIHNYPVQSEDILEEWGWLKDKETSRTYVTIYKTKRFFPFLRLLMSYSNTQNFETLFVPSTTFW